MTEYPPPKQVGPETNVTITGMLFPWKNDQPVLICMRGVGDSVNYLPLFDDPSKLRAVLKRAGVPFDSIKQVDDGPEFMDSIPTEILIVTDLRFTSEGSVRYRQVQR